MALDQSLVCDSERSKYLNFNETQDNILEWPILPYIMANNISPVSIT